MTAGKALLFHVAADPEELDDLAAKPAHRDRLTRLTGSLKTWLRERGYSLAE